MIEVVIEVIVLAAVLAGLAVVVLAALSDMKTIRAEPALRKSMHRLTGRRQPHVTILLHTNGDPADVVRSIRIMYRSHYRRYDVVVIVPNCTLAQRRDIIASVPIEHLHVYAPRTARVDTAALLRAYNHSGRGEIVVLIDDQTLLEPDTIKRSAALLEQHDDVQAVRLLGPIQPVENMMELYHSFAELSRRVIMRAVTEIGIHSTMKLGFNGVYRAAAFRQALKSGAKLRAVDSRGVAASEQATTPSNNVSLGELVTRMFFIALVVYSAISAALLRDPMPLLLLWAAVSLWLLVVVWSDSAAHVTSKFGLTVCVPIGIFVITAYYVVFTSLLVLRQKAF